MLDSVLEVKDGAASSESGNIGLRSVVDEREVAAPIRPDCFIFLIMVFNFPKNQRRTA